MEIYNAREKARKLFLSHSERILGEMMEHSSLITYIYYPGTQTCDCFDISRIFGEASLEGDYPDCMIRLMNLSEQDEKIMRNTVALIDSGSPSAECTVETHMGGMSRWIGMRWINFTDQNSSPDHCLVFGFDLTPEKSAERDFADQELLERELQGKIIATYCFNVTGDYLVSAYIGKDLAAPKSITDPVLRDSMIKENPVASEQRPETMAYLLRSAAEIPDPEMRRKFIDMCSHVGMINAFAEGKTEQELEYQRMIGEKMIWVSTRLVLVRHPDTKELYSFLYTSDINTQKQSELAIDVVVRENCDYISVIDPYHNTEKFLYMSDFLRQSAPTWLFDGELPYDDKVNLSIERELPSDKRNEFHEAVSLEKILAELEKVPSFVISYNIRHLDKDMYKQVTYRWLDDTKSRVLVIQQDVTAAWVKEQDAIRRQEEASLRTEKLKTDNKLLRIAALDMNEFVSVINIPENTIELRYGSFLMHSEPTPPDKLKMDINEFCDMVAEKYLTDEESEVFRSMADPAYIESELAVKDEVLLVFNCSKGFPETHRKLIRAVMLDREKRLIALTESDITELYNKERRIELDDLILKRTVAETVDFIAVLDLATEMLTLRFGCWELPHKYRVRRNTAEEMTYSLFESICEIGLADIDKLSDFHKGASLRRIGDLLCTEPEVVLFIDLRDVDDPALIYKKQLRYTWLDRNDRLVLLTGSDVTKSVAAEQERSRRIEEALAAARQANNAKLDFISRISHDIRTPLSAVKSMTEFALRDMDDKEKLRHDLGNIESAGKFLNSLINDILDISKIDSGQIEIHPEPYPYSSYKDELHAIVYAEAEKRGINVVYNSSCEELSIMTDPVRWRQITLNIVMNALKYTPAGGTVKISDGHSPAGDGYVLCYLIVEDNGIGMSEEYKKHLFEPFRQDDENPERRKLAGGTGLGMYIVKRLTELLGGNISVESTLGKGTKVTIYMKTQLADDTSSKTDSEREESNSSRLSGRVLLAEDNEINTEIALRLLKEIGLEADHAEDGSKAVDMFENAPEGYYRAVLMDIQMPLLNGYQAAEKIREMRRSDSKSIPIIAMTADAFESAKRMAEKAGFNEYLTKPLDMQRVKEVLISEISKSG